jgi:outer membrane protein assembly factor BamB
VLSPDGAVVFAGSEGGAYYALRAADGALLWQHGTQYPVNDPPLLSPDGAVMYTGSADHDVVALNATDGSIMWTYTVDQTKH